MTSIESIISRIRRLFTPRLVSAPSLREGTYQGPHGILHHSAFNCAWLRELSIVPSVIFDVGAFDGGDAFRFSQDFPTARCICIEADSERFEIVQRNLAGSRIDVVNTTIQDRDGEVNWFPARIDGNIDGQGSIYLQTDRLNRRHPQVQQKTDPVQILGKRLDTLASEMSLHHIDFMHMDIQGAEYAALLGLGELRPKVIYLETVDDGWVGAGSKQTIHELLSSMGYILAADFKNDRLYLRQN